MEKANTTKDKYIKLSDLLFAVWDKIIILIIIGAVIAAGVFAMEYLKAKKVVDEVPSYLSQMELYMGPKANLSSGTAYSELFLSDKVIQEVISSENISATVKEVRSYLYAEEREATLFRLVILTPEKELTEKIAAGMSTVGLAELTSTVDSSQMKVIQMPGQPKPVKSNIEQVQTAYTAMSVKTFPGDLVTDWETYYNDSMKLTSMIIKAVFAGVAAAGFVAVCLIVIAIFKRKLRYPADIEYASDLNVILTVDQKKQGLHPLVEKLLDFSDGGKSFIFVGGRSGDGSTTMAEAAVEGMKAMGEQATYVPASEVSENMVKATQGYLIADGGSFGGSYEGVSKSKWFDGTVLVIGEDSVDDVQIHRMKSDLTATGANILGIILNKAKVDRAGRKSRYFGSYYGSEQ